ncbi:MAG: transcription antitermination factor NusB [Betaproteobacteria bacterium]
MKTARRQAREIALQALYAWQLSKGDPLEEARSAEGFDSADPAFAEGVLRGVVQREEELRGHISPHLDRDFARLSPVERAILYIGTWELLATPETPFKVIVNEAVELGKSFGAAEGHRFVNGVLEKVATALRPEEVAKARKSA